MNCNIDYHVAVDGHRYSVPCELVREEVEVRLSAQCVEVLRQGRRAAAHVRSRIQGGFTYTNGIESFWSMPKRAHKGTLHKFSPKHLDRYVQEFAGRHNVREQDTIEQLGSLRHGMEGKRLTY